MKNYKNLLYKYFNTQSSLHVTITVQHSKNGICGVLNIYILRQARKNIHLNSITMASCSSSVFYVRAALQS